MKIHTQTHTRYYFIRKIKCNYSDHDLDMILYVFCKYTNNTLSMSAIECQIHCFLFQSMSDIIAI